MLACDVYYQDTVFPQIKDNSQLKSNNDRGQVMTGPNEKVGK